MVKIQKFTFNPIGENTYILYDETKECILIDPGCYFEEEKKELETFIVQHKLTPVQCILTHCHLDHVFGTPFIFERFKLSPQFHESELFIYNDVPQRSLMFNIPCEPLPPAGTFLNPLHTIQFGNQTLKMIFVPGHSPGSIAFYHEQENFIISGDVLFQMSIGRTDLPLGNYDTLIHSITSKLFALPDITTVYAGHGPETSIGFEKMNNPFIK